MLTTAGDATSTIGENDNLISKSFLKDESLFRYGCLTNTIKKVNLRKRYVKINISHGGLKLEHQKPLLFLNEAELCIKLDF